MQLFDNQLFNKKVC